ncbi:MAG: carbamoyl-phosphate synthase large subunit [Spirochaetales bacterium]|nr:carbamoyl-phosphate synthase large subunit [Spirochaetales bacterium]
MPARKDLKKILLIGSGPIVIGQACEFDYSGTQAVMALKEEGYQVVLINPNPATMMTTPGLADTVYMEPLTPEYMEKILQAERPDAVITTMGGQTALNLALKMTELGLLKKYGVEVIGANIDAIRLAEDRGLFKKKMAEIGLESPRSKLVTSYEEARELELDPGFPLILRPSFTLGGMGGAIARNSQEFKPLLEHALAESPAHSCLVEESLIGWKEFEMEVMRDKNDNAIVVCSIENIDPMGVHTGDSITIAPIQTLSDREYQRMRTASIDVLRAVGVDCGGSNVQFAVNPENGRMLVIEMNPRVSRSSALASKATGFPIAKCSARLAVGYSLDEVVNEITGKTVSCFEPALDYCAVKVPRFELEKFPAGYKTLGTQMKSVGESLALGRTALEALNKAIRSAEAGYQNLQELSASDAEIETMLDTLHPRRLFAAFTKLKRQGIEKAEEIHKRTGFDPWFLQLMIDQLDLEARFKSHGPTPELLLEAKQAGLSDHYLGNLIGRPALEIENLRDQSNIHSSYHFVDTCAGEFEAQTPFFYSTYGEIDEGGASGPQAVAILGSGPNRIGQGLEFDTGCTLASLAFRKHGRKTLIINSNPETVSTDYNVSDRLFIEPLTPEYVKEILRKEGVRDVVVQLGGQTPLNMAGELQKWGANILGTSLTGIDATEDRGLFSQLITKLGLRQPPNRMAGTPEAVRKSAQEIGFPVLLRPSFVLGGRSMFIASTPEDLEIFFAKGVEMNAQRPVLVDHFLEDAFEYDLDAVSDGKNVYIGGIMEHIEAAGIHSGDSACVFPAFMTKPHILEEMVQATAKIARDLPVVGFLNIQFAEKDGLLYILEVNPRASRTVPFLSKASGVNLVEAGVRVWMGENLVQQGLVKDGGIGVGTCLTGWAVKEAVFSFDRFQDLDPMLGPEMKSTGETMGTGASFGEAYAKAQAGVGTTLPTSGRIFVSVHDLDKESILPIVRDLHQLGFEVSATPGTADFLAEHGIRAESVQKIQKGHPNVIDLMQSGAVHLLINTPKGRYSHSDDAQIRIEAVRRKIPYTTTVSAARATVEGIKYLSRKEFIVRPMPKLR